MGQVDVGGVAADRTLLQPAELSNPLCRSKNRSSP
jgi:hypothetical protein